MKNLGEGDQENHMLFALCFQPKNVNFVKYGDELVDHQMKQFLRLEDIDMNRSSKKGMSIKDQEAKKRMENSVCVVGGHYEVGMLWKSDTPWLPNNKQTAEARLQSLKRKLKRDENFHRKYREFMENLIQKGYAGLKKRWCTEAKGHGICHITVCFTPKSRAKFV